MKIKRSQKTFRLGLRRVVGQKILKEFFELASWPPPAANARPSGLKRHSRGEDAFKEGRCIQGGIRRHSRGINADTMTDRQTDILCAL